MTTFVKLLLTLKVSTVPASLARTVTHATNGLCLSVAKKAPKDTSQLPPTLIFTQPNSSPSCAEVARLEQD